MKLSLMNQLFACIREATSRKGGDIEVSRVDISQYVWSELARIYHARVQSLEGEQVIMIGTIPLTIDWLHRDGAVVIYFIDANGVKGKINASFYYDPEKELENDN